MKNKDLYIAIGDIDEKFVEEAAKAAEKHRLKMRAAALRIGTAAACIALAAVAVPVALRLSKNTPEPPADIHTGALGTNAPDTDAPTTDTPTTDAPDTVAPGTDAPEPDFVIENGVLWNYNGDDTDVVIPDEVIEVAETAFENSPQVESVTLGKNTEYVAPGTFLRLMALKNVYVPEENTFYESVDEKTIVNKGDLFNFESIHPYSDRLFGSENGAHTESDEIFEYFIGLTRREKVGINRLGKFSVGSAVFETELYSSGGDNYLTLKAVTVYGRRIDFEKFDEIYSSKAFEIIGYRYFQAFWAGDVFVVSSLYYGSGFRIIVTENDLFVCVCGKESDNIKYEEIPETCRLFPDSYCSLTFYEKDGVLHYERIPTKYSSRQIVGGWIRYCAGKDELYQETGRVMIEDGTVKTVPETKVTISEAIDLEKEYTDWCNNIGSLIGLDPEKISLDEYLLRNGPDAPWAQDRNDLEFNYLFQKEE